MRWIISLGGSLLTDKQGEVNTPFLHAFVRTCKNLAKDHQLFIVVGGGKLARTAITQARSLGITDNRILDWIGIQATRLHAHMIRGLFGEEAHQDIITNPHHNDPSLRKNIVLAGGSEPGHSTDAVAVTLARTYQAQGVINLSNVPYIYDEDPTKNPHAQPYATITYHDLLALLGDFWEPGRNIPFDPLAIKEAAQNKIPIYFLRPVPQLLEDFITQGTFEGTLINDTATRYKETN